MFDRRIGIIGCGNMGEALLKGILSRPLLSREDIIASEKNISRRDYISQKFSIKMADSAAEVLASSDMIILAVKPEDIAELLRELTTDLGLGHVLVSIAAGISTTRIEKGIGKKISVIRAMPNSPILVNQAITALAYGQYVTDNDKIAARAMFSALGEIVEVKEDLMDVVTAISGSGPAYFILVIEYLTKIGVNFGLDRKVAYKLASQTALGSARMLVKTAQAPDVLRKKVTSPGGTTEAALDVFKKMNLEQIYTEAVKAAIERSKKVSGGR